MRLLMIKYSHDYVIEKLIFFSTKFYTPQNVNKFQNRKI